MAVRRFGGLPCLGAVWSGEIGSPFGHRVEEAPAVDGLAPENMGTDHSGTDGMGGYVPTVSENEDLTVENQSKNPETDEGEESKNDGTGSVPDDEDSFDEGFEGLPGDEPLPALNLRIEGYDGDTVVCTVVGNEGCTFYPVGSVVVLRFDIWEGDPVTETTFTRGGVYSVLFNGGHDNSDENTLYAVVAYQLEE